MLHAFQTIEHLVKLDLMELIVYGTAAFGMQCLCVYLFTSLVFGLDLYRYGVMFVVVGAGGVYFLSKAYRKVEETYHDCVLANRAAVLADRGTKVQRQQQVSVLKDTMTYESIAYALFLNNCLFLSLFLWISSYLLPKFLSNDLSALSYILSVGLSSTLTYQSSEKFSITRILYDTS